MDPSLSDILASVTRAHNAASGLDEGEAQRHDLQLLTQAWVAERVAPELLPYPGRLMERTMNRIRRQTELERFKFLVRSFLRARIAKIDAHPLHVLALHNPDLASQSQSHRTSRLNSDDPLMSPSEASYAQTHAALLERHYTSSFLSSFPQKLRRLDDRAGAGGVGMVEGPDLDKALFVRCLGVKQASNGTDTRRKNQGFDLQDDDDMDDALTGDEHGKLNVSCGFTGLPGDRGMDDGQRRVQMRRGDIWIVRWRGVRDAVARGECELI